MRAYGVADLARIGTPGLFDGLDDDVRGRQRTGFFGQTTAERFHELVVDLLAAELRQQSAHLGDVLFVAPPLLSALLEHRRATRRPTGAAHGRTTRARRTHAWSRRTWSHWAAWPRAARATRRPLDRWPGGGCSELWLGLTTAASTTACAGATRATPFTADLFAAMLAARQSAPITIELAVGVQIVSFEITVDALASRPRGSTSGGGLDHHQRSFLFLGNLGGRQPGLL